MYTVAFFLFSEAESRRKELDDDLTAERSALVACADRMEEIDKEIQQVGRVTSGRERTLGLYITLVPKVL